MRRTVIIGTALPLLLIGSVAATAHALLNGASPLVGSSVQSPPREVSLTFTQNLEASFSTMSVTNASGQRVDVGNPQRERQHDAYRSPINRAGHLSGALARSIGRYAYHVW
jgi:methionine-rich copper-binding protein CopC